MSARLHLVSCLKLVSYVRLIDVTDPREPSPVDRSGTPPPDRSGARRTDPVRWPVWIALPLIFGVFVAGAVWSFREQTALARSAGFHIPELLPLVIDGFAAAMAAVAWAASLDGRAAVLARLGIAVGIACSVGTNAAWAWERSGADRLTVILAGGVPVLAMLAFEAVLAEVRRQVQRRRGLPQPDPIPFPRLVTLGLSPFRTPRLWRQLVLELTDPRKQFEAVRAAGDDRPVVAPEPGPEPMQEPVIQPVRTGTNVTPINRSGPGRARKTKVRQTGRVGMRLTDHSETAVEDAEAVLDRYGDDIPGRETVRLDMGWGSPKAGNALKAVPAVRAARRDRSTNGQADRPESDDDQESKRVAV
jgi:Protein of unknown function (DUF2637)